MNLDHVKLITRRQALDFLGAGGAISLVGCGNGSGSVGITV